MSIIHGHPILARASSHVPPNPFDLIDYSVILLESCLHAVNALELLNQLDVVLLRDLGGHFLFGDFLPGVILGFALLPSSAIHKDNPGKAEELESLMERE